MKVSSGSPAKNGKSSGLKDRNSDLSNLKKPCPIGDSITDRKKEGSHLSVVRNGKLSQNYMDDLTTFSLKGPGVQKGVNLVSPDMKSQKIATMTTL